jgi:oligosaccharide repeat unit polymerase
LYLFGGVTAIEELFKGATIAEPAKHFFLYSFDFIFYILLKIGLISEYPSYLRDYVFISDDTTNVYTFLDCFFLDAGYLGVFIGVFFLSTICSLLYIFFKRQKNILSFQLYLLLFTNLSMCFMNNEFIRISFFINVFEIILFNKIIVSKKVTY